MHVTEARQTRLPRRVSVRRPSTTSLAPPTDGQSPGRVMVDISQNLRSMQVEVSRVIQQCQSLLNEQTDDRSHRDVLHLLARVQGVEQCTRDAEQTLARLRSRTPIGEMEGSPRIMD